MDQPPLSFLIAGVQKAGTTALFSYLAEHPELQAPSCKELHIFDGDAFERTSLDATVDAFFPPADGRLRFEATPVTLYWPQALERVRAYRPEMRLILLFRDPAERAFSQWRMERARGLESEAFGQQPAETLREVTDFIGVSALKHVQPRFVRPQTPDFHEPLEISYEDRDYLRLVYAKDKILFNSLVGSLG